MSNDGSPGADIKETTMQAESIKGVGTSTVAFIGGATQGPITEPTLVTSLEQFTEIFGALDFSSKGFYLAHAVSLFFLNGGQRVYVVRVTDETPFGTSGRTKVAYHKGLPCLESLEDVNLLAMPDTTDIADQQEMIRHCEKMRYRFAIVDSPANPREIGDAHDIKLQSVKLASVNGYAAIYYPWLQIQDPRTKRIRIVPPSGAVAGVYARVDLEKGVAKAPTNEPVVGAIDTEVAVDQADQNDLNRIGVNVIRKFTGKGLLVWGARTSSSDSVWKYVNVRRTAMYLEESISEGTEWVVFEPHDEITWVETKRSVVEFLAKSWKDGLLLGSKQEEAFFVRCDRTTMSQDDIDNGILIIEVGVALIRPAEFLVLRIGHQMERVGPRNLVDKKLDGTKKKKHYYMARTMPKE